MSGPRPWGVGMPAFIKLHHFGDVLMDAFGQPAYLVGSALKTKRPRDIDVRLPFADETFVQMVGRIATFGQTGTRWAALALAFSALGKEMTGKPIDFQVQPDGIAWTYQDEPRMRLGTKDGDQ